MRVRAEESERGEKAVGSDCLARSMKRFLLSEEEGSGEMEKEVYGFNEAIDAVSLLVLSISYV